MNKRGLAGGAVLLAAAAFLPVLAGDSSNYGSHDVVLVVAKSGYYLIEEDASGTPTLHKIERVVTTSQPPTPTPIPIPIPSPSGTITDIVKSATALVPSYAAKEEHRRTLAFVMNYMAPLLARGEVSKSRLAIKGVFDRVLGADALKWSGWMTAVDAKLDAMSLTSATYSTALTDIANALTADLSAAAPSLSEMFGRETYGLDLEKIKSIMEWLIPLIIQIMALLK